MTWSELVRQEEVYRHFSSRKTFYLLPWWRRWPLLLLPTIYAEADGVRFGYKVDLHCRPYLISVERIKEKVK